MAWQIKPFSHRCFLTNEAFQEGDRYASYLVIGPENEMERFDVSVDREDEFTAEGEVVCKWRQVYKPPPPKDDSVRRQKETAESLFFSLFEEPEPSAEGETDAQTGENGEESETAGAPPDPEEREATKKFLALFLERKRILKARGHTPDRKFLIMEHMKTRGIFMVPAGSLKPDEVMKISQRLEDLVK